MRKLGNYFRLITVTCAFCLAMTGCGKNDNGSTSGNNDNNGNDNSVMDDVADGIGNAVDDLVGNGGFDNYTDAHDYFLETMGAYHSDASFELRNEDQNLNDYQEGSKGYHFHLYDTSNNTEGDLFGEFFVDANSGMIYQRGNDGTISEYPGSTSGTSTGASNNTNGTTNNNTTGNGTTNNSTTGNGTTTGKNTTNTSRNSGINAAN